MKGKGEREQITSHKKYTILTADAAESRAVVAEAAARLGEG